MRNKTLRRAKRKSTRKQFPITKLIAYLATLALAGFVVSQGTESTAAWTFLGMSIGLLFGRYGSAIGG